MLVADLTSGPDRDRVPEEAWRLLSGAAPPGTRDTSFMQTRRRALSLALAAGLAPPTVVRAQRTAQQAWRPERPIRMIVPFAPGGSNDIVGRIIAEAAGQTLGQPIVVDN